MPMESARQTAHILVFDDADGVARAAADRFVEVAQASIADRGRFSVALAGGSTPRRTYQLLATGEFRDRIPWTSVHIFFGVTVRAATDADSTPPGREAMIAFCVPERKFIDEGEGDPLSARVFTRKS